MNRTFKRLYSGITIFIFVMFIFSAAGVSDEETEFKKDRFKMVEEQIEKRGIKDKSVIYAMRKVKRHKFIPVKYRASAYEDHPLPIGFGRIIAQPYIVAFMTESLGLQHYDKVLEIGTGSGYQTAVLSEIVDKVYTVEILSPLYIDAKAKLSSLGYNNVKIRQGDSYYGWQEEAPFDAIIVTAASPQISEILIDQLRVGGKMIVPVGKDFQKLYLIEKNKGGYKKTVLSPVRFVPMVHSLSLAAG